MILFLEQAKCSNVVSGMPFGQEIHRDAYMQASEENVFKFLRSVLPKDTKAIRVIYSTDFEMSPYTPKERSEAVGKYFGGCSEEEPEDERLYE